MVTFLIQNIPEDVWEKFKLHIPRTKTLNEAMIELIAEFNQTYIQNEKD